jgi:hypothetical protein
VASSQAASESSSTFPRTRSRYPSSEKCQIHTRHILHCISPYKIPRTSSRYLYHIPTPLAPVPSCHSTRSRCLCDWPPIYPVFAPILRVLTVLAQQQSLIGLNRSILTDLCRTFISTLLRTQHHLISIHSAAAHHILHQRLAFSTGLSVSIPQLSSSRLKNLGIPQPIFLSTKMATLQELRLGYHSRVGLEPGNSGFSTLHIDHYATRGILPRVLRHHATTRLRPLITPTLPRPWNHPTPLNHTHTAVNDTLTECCATAPPRVLRRYATASVAPPRHHPIPLNKY